MCLVAAAMSAECKCQSAFVVVLILVMQELQGFRFAISSTEIAQSLGGLPIVTDVISPNIGTVFPMHFEFEWARFERSGCMVEQAELVSEFSMFDPLVVNFSISFSFPRKIERMRSDER